MALTKNLKFKENDVVIDIENGYYGIITGYLGHGFYALGQVRVGFSNISDEFVGNLNVSLERSIIHGGYFAKINDEELQGKYVQSSRFLLKADDRNIIRYNEMLEIPEGEELYILDDYNYLYKLNPNIYVKFRTGSFPCLYSQEMDLEVFWKINGNVFTKTINNVEKIEKATIFQFKTGRILTKNEAEFVFNWEKEYAPFVIQGKIL